MAARKNKSTMAKNIRNVVTSTVAVDSEKEANNNAKIGKTVAAIAGTLGEMSEKTEKVFNDILDALKEIPHSLADIEKQNSDVMKQVTAAILQLDEELEQTNDPEQKELITSKIEKLKGIGQEAFNKSTEGKLPSGPTSFKELIPAMFGVTQQSRKEAGGSSWKAAKTAIGASFKGIFGIGTPDPSKPASFDENLSRGRAQVQQNKDIDALKGGDDTRSTRAENIRDRDKVDKGDLSATENEFLKTQGFNDATIAKIAASKTSSEPVATATPKFGGSGSDAKTDSSSEDLLAKMEEVDENTDELEEKTSGGIASLLTGLIPAMLAGIAPLMAMLLPALGAIAMPLLGIVAAVLAVVAIVKLFKFFQKKNEEKKLAAAQLDDKITDMRAAGKSEEEIRDALTKENPELATKSRWSGKSLLDAGMNKTEDSKKKVAELDDKVTKLRAEGKSDFEIRKVLAKEDPKSLVEISTSLDKNEKEKTAAKKAAGAGAAATDAPATAASAAATDAPATAASAAAPAVATVELAPSPTAAAPAAALGIASISAADSASGRVPAQAAIEQQSALSSAASAAPTIINNSTDNSRKSSSSGGGQSSGGATITLRDVHNSYMRFQEKRMARVM